MSYNVSILFAHQLIRLINQDELEIRKMWSSLDPSGRGFVPRSELVRHMRLIYGDGNEARAENEASMMLSSLSHSETVMDQDAFAEAVMRSRLTRERGLSDRTFAQLDSDHRGVIDGIIDTFVVIVNCFSVSVVSAVFFLFLFLPSRLSLSLSYLSIN